MYVNLTAVTMEDSDTQIRVVNGRYQSLIVVTLNVYTVYTTVYLQYAS